MRISLLFLLASAAIAQTTTVTGTITDPTGDLVSGTAAIQSVAQFTTSGGWTVTGAPMMVPFTNGAFRANLAPTDTASPSGQYYQITLKVPTQTLANGRSVQSYSQVFYWLVPTSSSPLTISEVQVTSPPPSPSWNILPQQITSPGYTGTACMNFVNGIGTGWVACSGSSGNLSLGALTTGQLGAMTTGQLGSMGN